MTENKSNIISDAQLEVWKWKEMIHDEVKDMELSEGLRYILKKSQETMDKLLPGKRYKNNAA